MFILHLLKGLLIKILAARVSRKYNSYIDFFSKSIAFSFLCKAAKKESQNVLVHVHCWQEKMQNFLIAIHEESDLQFFLREKGASDCQISLLDLEFHDSIRQ